MCCCSLFSICVNDLNVVLVSSLTKKRKEKLNNHNLLRRMRKQAPRKASGGLRVQVFFFFVEKQTTDQIECTHGVIAVTWLCIGPLNLHVAKNGAEVWPADPVAPDGSFVFISLLSLILFDLDDICFAYY